MSWHQGVLAAWAAASLAWVYVLAFHLPSVEHGIWLILLGIFLADAGSYIFHYLVDHYGRPVPGSLVHEFQRHHLIPYGIVEKPLSEVLYPAARMATPLLAVLGVPLLAGWLPAAVALLLFVLISCWVLAQLFHRWAHMQVGLLIGLAQRVRLVVSPHEHDRHHRQPFESDFAVITGWSNWVLDSLHAPYLLDWLMQALGHEKRGLVRSLEELSAAER